MVPRQADPPRRPEELLWVRLGKGRVRLLLGRERGGAGGDGAIRREGRGRGEGDHGDEEEEAHEQRRGDVEGVQRRREGSIGGTLTQK